MYNQDFLTTINRDFIPKTPSIYLVTENLSNNVYTNQAFRLYLVEFTDSPFTVNNVTNAAVITWLNELNNTNFVTAIPNALLNCIDVTISEDGAYNFNAAYNGMETTLSFDCRAVKSFVLTKSDYRRAYRRFLPQGVFTEDKFLPDGTISPMWTLDNSVAETLKLNHETMEKLSNSLLASKADIDTIDTWLFSLGLSGLNLTKNTISINDILQFFSTLHTTNGMFDLAYALTQYLYIRTKVPTYVYVNDNFHNDSISTKLFDGYRVTANANYPVNGVILTSTDLTIGQTALLFGDDGNLYNKTYQGEAVTVVGITGYEYGQYTMIVPADAVAGHASLILLQDTNSYNLPWDGVVRKKTALGSAIFGGIASYPSGLLIRNKQYGRRTTQILLGSDGNIYSVITQSAPIKANTKAFNVVAGGIYPVSGTMIVYEHAVAGNAGILLGIDGNLYNLVFNGVFGVNTPLVYEDITAFGVNCMLVRSSTQAMGQACLVLDDTDLNNYTFAWDGVVRTVATENNCYVANVGFFIRRDNVSLVTAQLLLGTDGNAYVGNRQVTRYPSVVIAAKYRLRKRIYIEVQNDAGNAITDDIKAELDHIVKLLKVADVDYVVTYPTINQMHSDLTGGALDAQVDVLSIKYDNRTAGYEFIRYDYDLATKIEAYISPFNIYAIKQVKFAGNKHISIDVGDNLQPAITIEYWDGTTQAIPDYSLAKISTSPLPNKYYMTDGANTTPPTIIGGNQSVTQARFSYRGFNQNVIVTVRNTQIDGAYFAGDGTYPSGVVLFNQYQSANHAWLLLGDDGNSYCLPTGLVALGGVATIATENYNVGSIAGTLIRDSSAPIGGACFIIGNDGNCYTLAWDGVVRAATTHELQWLQSPDRLQMYGQPKTTGRSYIELHGDNNIYSGYL